jgi:hypothetical protein
MQQGKMPVCGCCRRLELRLTAEQLLAQWHWADDARSGTDERCDQSRLSHYRIAGSERQYGSIKHHRWSTTSYQPE